LIKSINKTACVQCGLCEKICPMDVFRSENGEVLIAHQKDCCTCLQCAYICPTDAVEVVSGKPGKFSTDGEWFAIKAAMGFKTNTKEADERDWS